MKCNRYLLGLALLVVGTMPVFSQVSNDNEDEVYKIDARAGRNDFVPGQVLVKFKDDTSAGIQRARGKFKSSGISVVDNLLKDYRVKDVEELFPNEETKPKARLRKTRAYNGTIVEEKNLDKVFWIKTKVESRDSTKQLIEQLKAMPEVEYAEPNYYAYITADVPSGYGAMESKQQQSVRRAPVAIETTAEYICLKPSNNPLYFHQYGITQQNIQKLWDKPIINKKRPVIAILDTGVDINHPDLAANIWTNTAETEGETAYDDDGNGIVDDKYGWNFIDDYGDLTDRNGHGTHVAGIAAAADNSIGIVGANPLALIMPIKVMNDRGVGDVATICRGIVYAAENGADIINMSFGHGEYISATEVDAIKKAYQTAILVASAGNNGVSIYDPLFGPLWPAAYYLVLGVQATSNNGLLAGFSNFDPDGPIYSEDGIDGRNHEIAVPGVDIYSTLPDGKYNKLSGTSMSAPLFAGAISALQMVKDYPSKDVLFGDLIHMEANFAKIYSDDTPRTPKFDLATMIIDDNVEGNSNIDGQVDVGETIKFSPVLRNTWANATDINLRLTVDNAYKDFVTIQNPEVPFGKIISAYGRQTATTPIMVSFNNIGDNTRIKFTIVVSCAESSEEFTQDVYVTVHNMVKISGLITEDRTLTADHVYYVNGDLAVAEGITLTINPGTRIEVAQGAAIRGSGTIKADGEPGNPIIMTNHNDAESWAGISNNNSISYCILENIRPLDDNTVVNYPVMYDCIIHAYDQDWWAYYFFSHISGDRNVITGLNISEGKVGGGLINTDLRYTNIVNNIFGEDGWGFDLPAYGQLTYNNYFNNFTKLGHTNTHFDGHTYSLGKKWETPIIDSATYPSYLGTSKESVIRPLIYEIGNAPGTFGQIDLSNMPTRPYAEAHGIVWKVCVNGKDAQDEYEDLAPLGVGKHKFEVYFNRPMNKEVTPKISFGVREPYTQHAVDEEGDGFGWNDEGTIYTVYKTITGRIQSDGVNRIYVQGAEDNEYFECPYEKTRFNINIQAAGSMATGFAGEGKMGRVELTWNNEKNDFDDAMGFNIYRFNPDEKRTIPAHYDENDNWIEEIEIVDTICINKEIVDIETTEYTDYDVIPGNTYYYMYKVLSTDLKEYDVSNVVAATPLTSTRGDANGSGEVDVADVITTVNYAAGMNPKPFIFEAADMNTDQMIDILDIVGIIQGILNPSLLARAMAETAEAVYTIEDGTLYVDSPVALAGVQVQLATADGQEITVAEDLDGFEHTSAWLSDNDYLFLAYNMNGKTLSAGKHALLHIGDAEVAAIKLADAIGHNVTVVSSEGSEPTGIDRMGKDVMTVKGVYSINGQKMAGSLEQMKKLPKGVYIIDGVKVVK